MSLYLDNEFAIGLDPNHMAPLRLLNIAPPDLVIWRDAAVFYARGDMSRVGDGLPSWDWIWDTISIARLSLLNSLLAGLPSAWVYAHTPKRIGVKPNYAAEFYVYRAIMYQPILSGQEGTPIARAEMTMQTVKVTFVNGLDQSSGGYL